jgi:hypothetical protein
MAEADRDAALVAMQRQVRRLQSEHGLAWHIAAASFLALRGPLREVDDKLCRLPMEQLLALPVMVQAQPA